MYKFLALLTLAGAALALPNPNAQRRCYRYSLYNAWEPKYLCDDEWYVVASTPSGSVLSWQTDYLECDAYFTYGTECCGSCTFVRFIQNPKFTQYPAYTMVQYSYNDCIGDYNIVESFFGPAYSDSSVIYRSFTRELFDRQYLAYSETIDTTFISYDSYANDFSYSIGVLNYCPENQILILVICNTFNYLNYVDYPTIIVLAHTPRLNRAQKAWVLKSLEANNICPYGLVFRNNFNCKARCDYRPSIYW